jgi:nucleoside-diphosphate-sugar epimerase
MRILITGEAGFVGFGLALHLRQACSDATVVCMDNLYRRESALDLSGLQRLGLNFTGATSGMETVFNPAHSIISLSHSAELEQL